MKNLFFIFFCPDLTVQYTLKGHSRLVTDLDWNDSDPNVLVTASHDNYLHVWDVRWEIFIDANQFKLQGVLEIFLTNYFEGGTWDGEKI